MGRRTQDNQIDWELIQREYRLGQKSLRQIATLFAVQPSAISRKAKAEGWIQDKAKEVKAISDAQLLVSNRKKATEKATPTQEDVEVAATVRTNLILEHRQDIGRARTLFQSLLGEVETATREKNTFEAVLDRLRKVLDTESDESVRKMMFDQFDELRGDVGKLVSIPNRIDSAKKLVEMLERLVKMEREAFGIDGEEEKSKGAIDDLLVKIRGME